MLTYKASRQLSGDITRIRNALLDADALLGVAYEEGDVLGDRLTERQIEDLELRLRSMKFEADAILNELQAIRNRKGQG